MIKPQPPRDLDPIAKKAWISLSQDLEEQGTLVKTDRKLIELYARTYALWERAQTQLAEEPLSDGSDRRYINPLCNLYVHLTSQLNRILSDCGLTSRTRKVQATGETSSILAALNRTEI